MSLLDALSEIQRIHNITQLNRQLLTHTQAGVFGQYHLVKLIAGYVCLPQIESYDRNYKTITYIKRVYEMNNICAFKLLYYMCNPMEKKEILAHALQNMFRSKGMMISIMLNDPCCEISNDLIAIVVDRIIE